MPRTRWPIAAIIAVAVVLAPSTAVLAAHLELLDKQIDRHAFPPAADVLDPVDPCPIAINQTITSVVDPLGRHASLLLYQTIDAMGTEPTCNPFAEGLQAAQTGFLVAPDAGEAVGDPIGFCFTANVQEVASATGAYVADAAVGGFGGSGPATIILNPSGAAKTESSFGPVAVTQNDSPQTGGSTGGFHARIGDEIQIVLGDQATASGSGIGSAHVADSAVIQINVGDCAAPAPAMAGSSLALLALLLCGLGPLCMRRSARRRQRILAQSAC